MRRGATAVYVDPDSGVTVLLGADSRLVPASFNARTVKVYAVPSSSPLTVVWRAPSVVVPEQVKQEGWGSTW
jgi:hypothetical protein